MHQFTSRRLTCESTSNTHIIVTVGSRSVDEKHDIVLFNRRRLYAQYVPCCEGIVRVWNNRLSYQGLYQMGWVHAGGQRTTKVQVLWSDCLQKRVLVASVVVSWHHLTWAWLYVHYYTTVYVVLFLEQRQEISEQIHKHRQYQLASVFSHRPRQC